MADNDDEDDELRVKEILKRSADRFHKILSSIQARKFVLKPMPQKMLDAMLAKIMTDREIEKDLAAGFDECVRELHRRGDPTTSIFECNPTEGREGIDE